MLFLLKIEITTKEKSSPCAFFYDKIERHAKYTGGLTN